MCFLSMKSGDLLECSKPLHRDSYKGDFIDVWEEFGLWINDLVVKIASNCVKEIIVKARNLCTLAIPEWLSCLIFLL